MAAAGTRPVTRPPALPGRHPGPAPWLLMRAFASGCTAMTGVEAVSNGVPVFREPRSATPDDAARHRGDPGVLLAGIAFLCRAYGIGATEPGQPGYESVLSQLIGAVVGRGVFYYVTIGSVLAVLCLSANTSFADFPRLCRVLAQDGFLPARVRASGRAAGLLARASWSWRRLAAVLLVVFGGITDRLIPLFAVGAFLAFTLSQAAMVAHWRAAPPPRRAVARDQRRRGGRHRRHAGGRPHLQVRRRRLDHDPAARRCCCSSAACAPTWWRSTASTGRAPLDTSHLEPPAVVVPMKRLDRVARKALRFALTISTDVRVVQLLAANSESEISAAWTRDRGPLPGGGLATTEAGGLRSPYREVVDPLRAHVQRLTMVNPSVPSW